MKSIIIILSERFISLLLTFFIGIATLHHLEAEAVAILTQCLGIAAVCAIAVKLGNDPILLQRLAATQSDPRFFIRSIIKSRLLCFFIIAVFLYLYMNYIVKIQGWIPYLMTLALVFTQAFDIGVHWMRAINKHKAFHVLLLAAALLAAALTLVLIYRGSAWVYFIAPSIGSSGIITLVSLYYANKRDKRVKVVRTITISRNEALFAFLNSLIVVFYFRLDALMLPGIIGLEAAGNYFAAQRITEVTSTLLGAISLLITTVVSRMGNANSTKSLEIIFSSLNLAFYAGLICSGSVVMVGKLLVFDVFLTNYRYASDALFMLALGVPLFLQGTFIDAYLVAQSNIRLVMIRALVALVVKVIVYLLLPVNSSLDNVALLSIASAYSASLLAIYFGDRCLFRQLLYSINPLAIVKSIHTIRTLIASELGGTSKK